jgi:hypothetical protein
VEASSVLTNVAEEIDNGVVGAATRQVAMKPLP